MNFLVPEEKKNLIASLPFPIAYLYQHLLSCSKDGDPFRVTWALRNNYLLLTKFIGIFALCDFLQNGLDEDHESSPLIARLILDNFSEGRPDWMQLMPPLSIL